MAKDIAIGVALLIPGPVKLVAVSPRARCRCNESLEMCCSGAMPQGIPTTRYWLRRNSADIIEI